MTDGLPPLREVIAKQGLSARKSLGQNFILDLNLTRRIARSAGSLSDHDVLEIGPGPGGLTRALLAEGARHVVAIERDQRCLPILASVSEAYGNRLSVVEGDAKAIDPLQYLNAPVRVVANLPYNIGTELLIDWLTPALWPPFWSSLTLMFQKEVAERIVAEPGSKSYGRLSVLAQWRAAAHIAMTIPAAAFTPPPKVTSAVVHLDALAHPRFPADPEKLQKLTAAAFGQRRKMLRSSLKALAPDITEILEKSDIDPTRRAETLSIEEFCHLSRNLG